MILHRSMNLCFRVAVSCGVTVECSEGKKFIRNEPSELLATIAAPGIALAATAVLNVDSIEGILCANNPSYPFWILQFSCCSDSRIL
jgi:hypothetical protein